MMLATIGTLVVLILKIIGIALLCILGLILLTILIILFVPFRYSAEGSFDEELRIRVKFSWLLHLINGSATQHNKESDVRVRIALFQIIPKRKSKAKAKPVSKSKKEPSIEPSIEPSAKPSIDSKDETPKKQKQEKKPVKKANNKPQKKPQKKPAKKSENKSSAIEQFKAIWNFLQEDENEGLLRHVLKYIGRLIKWIFPRRAYANIEFGLDDPATTGYITGLTSIVYVKTRGNFQVIPNFHEEVIKGSLKIRGRLYLYQPVYYIIRIIIDKRVRRMLKFLKKRK
jgi:hypothetical protein